MTIIVQFIMPNNYTDPKLAYDALQDWGEG